MHASFIRLLILGSLFVGTASMVEPYFDLRTPNAIGREEPHLLIYDITRVVTDR
jgi:hypothetical protein